MRGLRSLTYFFFDVHVALRVVIGSTGCCLKEIKNADKHRVITTYEPIALDK